MHRLAAAAVFLLACQRAAPPAAPLANRPPPSPPAATADCRADIDTRAPGAEPEEGLDLDGDGDLDSIYRRGGDMFGNAEFLIYTLDRGCATYVGTLEAFMMSAPYCREPPTRGQLCILVAHRRMMHDDYQDTYYTRGPDGFVEVD